MKSAEIHREAVPEDVVRIDVNNAVSEDIKNCSPEGTAGRDSTARRFGSLWITLDHPRQVINNYTTKVDGHFAYIACKVAQIEEKGFAPVICFAVSDSRLTIANSFIKLVTFKGTAFGKVTMTAEKIQKRKKYALTPDINTCYLSDATTYIGGNINTQQQHHDA
ncbi:hypothetical protein RP20_CCG011052 [Aedes albopictus]|nr:hypothetical protein RP20_CCG011052 [Aedes albopictus]